MNINRSDNLGFGLFGNKQRQQIQNQKQLISTVAENLPELVTDPAGRQVARDTAEMLGANLELQRSKLPSERGKDYPQKESILTQIYTGLVDTSIQPQETLELCQQASRFLSVRDSVPFTEKAGDILATQGKTDEAKAAYCKGYRGATGAKQGLSLQPHKNRIAQKYHQLTGEWPCS